ncbi:alpha/beta hydrolase-fold protein [Flavobacterium sp.]|uniref:alpha/beta hydrolase n=1 Tax=Flavobacterium sp. TaxID=239 RepID=UPI00286C7EA3|nr:alpha/beta hydrolase-fold protein [Flavobacterium sp.]
MKIAGFFLLIGIVSSAQEIKVSSGRIERFLNFKSDYVDARNIDVWLPNGYSNKEKYAVLYMHDGQMLYDAETSWNKQVWEVDEVAGKLIAENKTRKFIVVGIWNNRLKRHPEYFPQKAYEKLTTEQKEFVSNQLLLKKKIDQTFHPVSDSYLKFIVTELKPFIDRQFSTKTDRKNTFIAGSSMGGLISMYAICEYPDVFGGAACLSTHWTGIYQLKNNPIPETFYTYLKQNLPNPKKHKIYFDHGDKTLDSLYPTLQKEVDKIMKQKGFCTKNWITKYFPGKDHSEKAWHERFHIPLEFLLKE